MVDVRVFLYECALRTNLPAALPRRTAAARPRPRSGPWRRVRARHAERLHDGLSAVGWADVDSVLDRDGRRIPLAGDRDAGGADLRVRADLRAHDLLPAHEHEIGRAHV